MSSIKVLVVDDSAFMRKMIRDLIDAEPDMQVVDVCKDGQEGVEKADRLRPDVVTLDVEMPVMDGLTALRAIMKRRPTAVVMLSSLTANGAAVTLRALSAGAADFVHKPSGSISMDIAKVRDELIGKIRAAASSNLSALSARPAVPKGVRPVTVARVAAPLATGTAADRVVAIGTSTGGPRALQAVVPLLPGDLPAGVIIVQHMPPKFTKSLAERLDAESALNVKEAEPGDIVERGMALLAPGDFHMVINDKKRVELTKDPPLWGVRPAVDIMLTSAIQVFGSKLLAVIMTGMGHDGRDGCGIVRRLGGRVISEHEKTCVIYGMPRSVEEGGYSTSVVPLDEIAQAICDQVGKLI